MMALGRTGPALESLQQAMTLGAPSAWFIASLAAARAYLGDTETAERMLAELEQREAEEWVGSLTIAAILAALGRYDDAATRVERAFEERDCWVVSLAVEPAWASLRGHPRFEAVVAKVGIMDRDAPKLPAAKLEHSGTAA